MKQGILITAYKNFEHLFDIASFFDSNFEIYIHIDKKSVVPQIRKEAIQSLPQVQLISRKYKVNWDGINHLKSILHLAEEALKNEEITRFHLISGHDFPIKPSSYFMEFFKKHYSSNFLTFFKFPLKQWPHGGLDRIHYYNLYDILDAKKHRKYIIKFVSLQRRLNLKRRLSKQTPQLYGGDTWWSLNKEALFYVINYTKTQPRLLKRLRYSFCSEEIYFQTVIMNSELAPTVVNDNLRYIDWSNRNGNFPANLDMTDLEKIRSTNKLFARKFDFPVSIELKEQFAYIN